MKNIKKSRLSIIIKSLSFTIFFILLTACNKPIQPAQNIVLNPLFSDNMVLQQKQDIPIWGSAEPGGEVIVTLQGEQKKATVGDDGKLKVSLAPVPAGDHMN